MNLEAVQQLTETNAWRPAPSRFPGDLRLQELRAQAHPSSILSSLYWIPRNNLHEKDIASLTLTPQVSSLAPKSAAAPFSVAKTHPKNPEWIGVPKFWGLSAAGPPAQDLRSEGQPLRGGTWNDAIQLRPEQVMAIRQARESLREWGGAFVTADCGFGKSICLSRLIFEEQKACMIVVPQTVLIQQMMEEFQASKKREPSLVGLKTAILQGRWEGLKADKQKQIREADVVVASLDSLSLFKYPAEVMAKFGLVVFDEAHHMAARTLCEVLPRIPARRIAGFSATPDRNDGLSHLLYWILGPPCFVFQRLPEITGKRGTVEIQKVQITATPQLKFARGGTLAFAEMLNDLASNQDRNNQILESIKVHLKDRHKILVISAFREHCEELLLQIKKVCDSAVLLHGGLKKSEKKETSDAKVLVATYGILQEGFDDADLDTLIMATPRSSVQQTVGRIERVKDGKLVPLVIDFVDSLELFESMWWKRRKFYTSRGFLIHGEKAPQKRKREDWNDCVEDSE